jgi:AcrR family transcriptional regulator
MEIRERIVSTYIHHLREEGKAPESVPRFCRELDLSEREFFGHFSSFDAIEKTFWQELILEVIERVESSEEYGTFDARQRLLTFFFAFNEKALEVRTLMLLRFQHLEIWKKPAWSAGFEEAYREFVKRILDHGRESGEVAGRGRVSNIYPDGFYLVFRSIIDFNMKDDSDGFERTDAFVEKSVNLAFDMVRTQALDSAIDLVRFLVPDMKWKPGT